MVTMNDRERDKNIKSLWRHIAVMKKASKRCMHYDKANLKFLFELKKGESWGQ